MSAQNKIKKINGTVIHGKAKGRTLGFPTANIQIKEGLDLEPGVYAGRIIFNGAKYSSALYLAGDKVIEAFIFDYSGDLYGAELEVDIVKKIRDKMVFKDDKESSIQISKDVLEIKKCLQE